MSSSWWLIQLLLACPALCIINGQMGFLPQYKTALKESNYITRYQHLRVCEARHKCPLCHGNAENLVFHARTAAGFVKKLYWLNLCRTLLHLVLQKHTHNKKAHMKRSSDSRRTRTSRRRWIRAISTSISSGAMVLSAMDTSEWPGRGEVTNGVNMNMEQKKRNLFSQSS